MSEEKPAADNGEEDDSKTEPEDEEMIDPSNCLSFLEIEEAIQKLQISAKHMGVSETATVHLDGFSKAVQETKLHKPKKKTTLHDFFVPK